MGATERSIYNHFIMMIYLIFTLLLACLLEGVVIPYPLTLFVIGLAAFVRPEATITLAFIAGVILDLLTLRLVGLSSLFFLSLIYLSGRYRKKIYGGTLFFRFLFLIIPYFVYSYLFYRNLNIGSLFITAVLTVAILFVLEKFFPAMGSKKRLAI